MDRFQAHLANKHCMTAKVLKRPSETERETYRHKEAKEDIAEDTEEFIEIQIPPPELNLQPCAEDNSPRRKRKRQSEAVLAASDEQSSEEKQKMQKLLLAKAGDWCPISLISNDTEPMEFNMLVGPHAAAAIIAKQPNGQWIFPDADLVDELQVPEISNNSRELIHHIVDHSTLRALLQKRCYTELCDEICTLLNEDWQVYPYMRYVSAKLLAGAILIEGTKALVINCVEAYGRRRSVDAHCERYLSGDDGKSSSLPTSFELRYDGVCVKQVNEDDVTKLKIGTRVSNFLVTSSVLLANPVRISVGPNMLLFEPSENTAIYLDQKSLQQAQQMLKKRDNCRRVGPSDMVYQLRQIRSKFHCQSSYTLCRAFSEFTDIHTQKPYTIWTLADADSTRKYEPDIKHVSRLFQSLAISVFANGSEAVLSKFDVQKAVSLCKSDSTCSKILELLLEIFGEKETIKIIGNHRLDEKLKDLAQNMTSAIKRANVTIMKAIATSLSSVLSTRAVCN